MEYKLGTVGDSSEEKGYEAPKLVAIGNLNDVVAGTTKSLDCDGNHLTGDGDHLGC